MNEAILKSILTLVIISSTLSIEANPMQADSIKKLSPAKWARSRKIDVKHIAIDLKFDWKKKQAYGTAVISLSPLNDSDKIKLDAGMLTINSVSSANGTSLKFSYDGGDKNDGLEITLDHVYKSNEDLIVKIDYHTNWVSPSDPNSLGGTNGKGLRFFGPTSTEPKRRQQIWTMGEAEGNRYWFPCYDAPNDLRITELTATVDKKFTVVSNGALLGTKDNPDGTRTFHYKTELPYANHLTSFIVGEYVDIKQSYSGIALRNYSFHDEVEATTASVAQLPEMIKYFSEMTGAKYPYQNYSQAFVQDLPWGIGNNGLAMQTENMVDDSRTHDDFFYLWDDLEGESLAQQWFGNYLTPNDWSHSWLSKSFGRYFSELYDEYKNGSYEFHLYPRQWDRSTYLSTWNSGYRHPLVTNNYDDAITFVTDSYTGFHGAEVLHMLRKQLGDEMWWKVIKLYVKANANKLVTTEDFRKAVEEASGEPMDWFFDQWVYKMGHPIFVITKNYDATKKLLTLTAKQTQKIDKKEPYPQVEFFQGKIEIEIDGRIETVWLEPKEENTFTFASAQQPKLVNFDYEDTWVKEITFEKKFEELLYQFQNGKDILGRRWAASELVNIAKKENTSAADKEKVYSVFRDIITSNCYWRFKWAVAIPRLQGLLAPASQTTAAKLDEATISTLLSVIKSDKAWVRSTAINFLGMTRDPKYADIYLNALNDPSDRVINLAAIALSKTKSPKAFPALAKLVSKPSWKNQSLLSTLFALKELGDPRGYDIAYKALSDLTSPHWVLAVPIWDYRIIAAQTIASLGKSDKAYPLLSAGFRKAMDENDIHGIFYNTLVITELAASRAQKEFDLLKVKFKDDANAMVAVNQYETQFKEAIKTKVK
jgi:aminopeptidase N